MRLSTLLDFIGEDRHPEVEAFYRWMQEPSGSLSLSIVKAKDFIQRIQNYPKQENLILLSVHFLYCENSLTGLKFKRTFYGMVRTNLRNIYRSQIFPQLLSECTKNESAHHALVYVTACLAVFFGDRSSAISLLKRLIDCQDKSLEVNAVTILYRLESDSYGSPRLLKLVRERDYDKRLLCYEIFLFAKEIRDKAVKEETIRYMNEGTAPLPLVLIPESPKKPNGFISWILRHFYGIKPIKTSASRSVASQTRRN